LNTPELIQRAKYLPIHSPVRTKFEYNNLLFALAGEVIPNATGTSWAAFVKKRIFEPLHMQASYTTLPEVPKGAELSEGHLNYRGEVYPIVLTDLSNIAPAGAIVSNLHDMTTWAQFQLSDGSLNGVRLLSNAALQETHSPQIVMTAAPPFGLLYPDAKLSAYGLGWMLSDFHGHLLIQHPGDTDGMSGLLAMVPDEQTAVVVLTNQQGAWLRSAVLFQILDSITDQPDKDRSAQYLVIAKAVEAQQAKILAAAASASQPPPADTSTRPLSDYVARYSNELYGNAIVEMVQGQLTLRLLGNIAQLNRVQGDVFAVHFQHPNALQQLMIPTIVFKTAGSDMTGFQIANGTAFNRTGS
jgi:CubicO group peptidase (beta-lactamase class C family)